MGAAPTADGLQAASLIVTDPGGQRSRVSLLRALLAAPAALLLDEPFGKLDTALRGQMRQFTFATLAARRVPVLLVTHDAADIPSGAQTIRLDDHA